MKPEDFGYNDNLEKPRMENIPGNFDTGRVIAEHKERYIVKTGKGDLEAEITGNLRFTAKSREDFPTVGDWVALTLYEPGFALIHKIFPRFSIIKRQAAGQSGETQVIAANIDYAFLVQSADRDFNINRLERYLTLCNTSKVRPVIVLTKIDLITDQRVTEITDNIKTRIKNVPIIAISNETHYGYEVIKGAIEKGKTYCMLGSSGVGKSTLLNNLSGRDLMKTDTISSNTHKGRHITSHRELIILDNGGILIDNPGMREVGITDTSEGLEITFERIDNLAGHCKFKDCTHTVEAGCAVLEAIAKGEMDKSSYRNFLKMKKEKTFFEFTVAERRKRDRKFGKMVKNFKKDMNKNKD